MTIAAALVAFGLAIAPEPARGHAASPPPVAAKPARAADPIPAADRERYRSHLIRISPAVPGLSGRVVGSQEKLEVTWRRRPALIIEGYRGEPMFRLGAGGIEVNRRSPSVYLSADRYAAVPVPLFADADAAPRWQRVETPGSFAWYDHRVHWTRSERPAVVGDGARGVTIFHWRIPARLGARRLELRGALDWAPDPGAVRDARSDTSSPLLSALALGAALALGYATGIGIRRRREA